MAQGAKAARGGRAARGGVLGCGIWGGGALRAAVFALVLGLAGAAGWPAAAEGIDKDAAALDAMRLLGAVDAAAPAQVDSARTGFLFPTPPETVDNATFKRAYNSGQQRVEGLQTRQGVFGGPEFYPYFEGTWRRIRHPYIDRDIFTYERGVYAVPQTAAYVGTFSYFPQPMEAWEQHPKGAIAVVGKKLTPDGKAETGIFIDEKVISGFALTFVKATPQYLQDFERRHVAAVENYRRRQIAEAESGFNFGQLLALGLGAAMIGSSDLPGADKLQIGQAFVSDVMGAGDGKALFNSMMANMPTGGGSLFDGSTSFAAPGLDGMIAGIAGAAVGGGGTIGQGMAGQGIAGQGIAGRKVGGSAVGGSAAGGGAQQAAARSENYSFTCPTGQNYSIPVSYKNASCGAAMKNFARVFSCNLINDMGSAQSRCQQACGNAQCAE